jgi:hypothetical protein
VDVVEGRVPFTRSGDRGCSGCGAIGRAGARSSDVTDMFVVIEPIALYEDQVAAVNGVIRVVQGRQCLRTRSSNC